MKKNVFFLNLILIISQVIEHIKVWVFNEVKNFPEKKRKSLIKGSDSLTLYRANIFQLYEYLQFRLYSAHTSISVSLFNFIEFLQEF